MGGDLFAGLLKRHLPGVTWEELRPIADEFFLSPHFSNNWRIGSTTPNDLFNRHGAVLALAVQSWSEKVQSFIYSPQPINPLLIRQASKAVAVIQSNTRAVALDLKNAGERK